MLPKAIATATATAVLYDICEFYFRVVTEKQKGERLRINKKENG
jgi:hypothetical protein